jgi:hypothetical protein
MEDVLRDLEITFTQGIPGILAALLILLLGLVVALILRALVHTVMDRFSIDERIERGMGGTPNEFNLKNILGQVVFWLVMLFAIVAALDRLRLTAVAAPLDNILNRATNFIPNLVGAIVLVLVAWVVATVLKRLIKRLLDATDWDDRLARNTGVHTPVSLGESIGTLVYWLVWLLFLPAILDALSLEGILAPVENMVSEILAFLPNLFSAAVILIIGYFVARVVRDIVTNLLASTGVDEVGERFGFGSTSVSATTVEPPQTNMGTVSETPPVPPRQTAVDDRPMTLSRVIGLLVYVLILIPVAIAALDALNVDAISEPAIAMLQDVLNAIPAIFAAFILLVIAYFVARFVGDLATRIAANVGFDRFLARLGVVRTVPLGRQPSEILGMIVVAGIMLFAATEAANLLGFEAIALMLANFVRLLGSILLGLLVIALGLYLANLADNAIRSSNVQNSNLLATVARYAIILLTATMGLRQMGIAEDIITLAFGLTLGAAAIAAAIAFGWGGRHLAERQLQKLEANVEERTEPPTSPTPPALG